MTTEDENIDNQPDNNEESGQESSITQVGDEKKKPIPTWVIIVGVVVAVVIILASAGGDEDKKGQSSDIEFSGEEYKVKSTPAPAMPRSVPPPKPTVPQPIKTIALEGSELSPEDKQRLRKEQEILEKRRRAPLILVNKRSKAGNSANGSGDGKASGLRKAAQEKMARLEANTRDALKTLTGGNGEKGGMGDISTADAETVYANYIEDRSYKILQGKFIPAVLETAINSDLPGMIRSIVSETVYSEDGNSLLIPKGSRLIGKYRSGVKQGQSRVFVIWSRLVRPDGIGIKLDSPGADSLGRAGLAGFVDTHFLERFGSSALLSLIGGFAQQESENDNQRAVLAESFSESAAVALENSINIPPTIHINQGEKINVFVAKDLNFKPAVLYAQRRNKF